MIRICCISDTHCLEHSMRHSIPSCDILIHSGDCCNRGSAQDFQQFITWFDNLTQAKNKVYIAGNHDFVFERDPNYIRDMMIVYDNVIYLEDESVEILGLKIYGSPWQPEFHSWAFNLPRNGKELEEKWSAIPDDTDILVTHGPPKNILDQCNNNGFHAGCEKMRERINTLNLIIHQFGHIHERYGVEEVNGTLFVNASTNILRYRPINKPIIIDIDVDTKKILSFDVGENIDPCPWSD